MVLYIKMYTTCKGNVLRLDIADLLHIRFGLLIFFQQTSVQEIGYRSLLQKCVANTSYKMNAMLRLHLELRHVNAAKHF